MKRLSFPALVFAIFILLAPHFSSAQTNEWAWMSGSNVLGSNCYNTVCGQIGVYGTMGKAASGNVPGGRYNSITWTDKSGNLWLYGGGGFDSKGAYGIMNDLWEFSPSSNQWTWINGSSTIQASCSCVPINYGTKGQPAKTNTPGSRDSSASWVDSNGNLWLFGGGSYDTTVNPTQWGNLNDLWMFNPTTAEWTWVGGTTTLYSPGVYGTLGQPNANNIPGSRYAPASWTDSSGNFWLFGGEGNDVNGCAGFENDLWMYSTTNSEWTWEGGQDSFGACGGSFPTAPGVYGTKGDFASTNVPLGRGYPLNWTDAQGNLWLYGGWATVGADNYDPADLWEYETTLKQWAWINGYDTTGPGSYYSWPEINSGQGNFNSGNTPGSRLFAVAGSGSNNSAYIFSGAVGEFEQCDFWEYDQTTNQWAWLMGIFNGCSGQYGTEGKPAPGNQPGVRIDAISWSDNLGNFWVFGGIGNDSTGLGGYLNDLWEFNSGSNLTTPTITWSPATPIIYPAPLSSAQFNASALNGTTNISTDGTFVYYVGPVSGGIIATTSTILPVGSNQLCVLWTPDSSNSSTYNSASGCANVVVLQSPPAAPTTTSISSNQNPVFVTNPVTFTATVTSTSGTPTGTVNFYDSNTIIGTQTLSNGQATFTTSSLIVGAHSIVARFVANATFAGSTSGYVSEYVDDFSISNAPSIIIPPVSSASMTFTVTPIGPSFTLPQNVTATVTGIPSGVQYSFNPSIISAGQSTTALSLIIESPIQASLHRESIGRTTAPLLLSLLLLPFASVFRRTHKKLTQLALLILITLVGAMSLTSCGSVLKTSTSTVTVTATSVSLSHSVSFQLTLD